MHWLLTVYIGAVTSLPSVSNLLVTLADPISAMAKLPDSWNAVQKPGIYMLRCKIAWPSFTSEVTCTHDFSNFWKLLTRWESCGCCITLASIVQPIRSCSCGINWRYCCSGICSCCSVICSCSCCSEICSCCSVICSCCSVLIWCCTRLASVVLLISWSWCCAFCWWCCCFGMCSCRSVIWCCCARSISNSNFVLWGCSCRWS